MLAKQYGTTSIAFAAISCSVYGDPAPNPARIALAAAVHCQEGFDEIRFVLFDRAMYTFWTEAAAKLITDSLR